MISVGKFRLGGAPALGEVFLELKGIYRTVFGCHDCEVLLETTLKDIGRQDSDKGTKLTFLPRNQIATR